MDGKKNGLGAGKETGRQNRRWAARDRRGNRGCRGCRSGYRSGELPRYNLRRRQQKRRKRIGKGGMGKVWKEDDLAVEICFSWEKYV